jgi:hypothetical protein
MFILEFSAIPEHVGQSLGLIPQLRATTSKWEALSRALEAIKHDHSPGCGQAAIAATADLVNESVADLEAKVAVWVDMVLIELPGSQHLSILPHSVSSGYLSVHARVSQINVGWIIGSLLRNRVNFTVTPDNSVEDAPEAKVEVATKGRLTRQVLDGLIKEFENPGELASFYDEASLVLPNLPELFLYSAAFLAIREKWNRRDWLMDSIIAHVKRVLTEVEVCLDEQKPSVFSWLDTEVKK